MRSRLVVMVMGALAIGIAGCGGTQGPKATRYEHQPERMAADEEDDTGDAPADDSSYEKDVRGIFERKQSAVARCYTKRLAEKPDLAKGSFEIKTTITHERAGGTEVRGVEWRDSEIESCVQKLVNEWTFSDVNGPQTVTYRYQFDKL